MRAHIRRFPGVACPLIKSRVCILPALLSQTNCVDLGWSVRPGGDLAEACGILNNSASDHQQRRYYTEEISAALLNLKDYHRAKEGRGVGEG